MMTSVTKCNIFFTTYTFLLLIKHTLSATYGTLVFKRGQEIDMARKFAAEDIVPDCIPYPPAAVLNVTFYNGDYMKCGKLYEVGMLQQPPFFSWDHHPDLYYALSIINIDQDEPSVNHTQRQIWLIINIPGDKTHYGDEIFPYEPPVKPYNINLGGLMRVVFLLYKQPNNALLNITEAYDPLKLSRCFKLQPFVEENKLGNPIAGNFLNMMAY